MADTVQEVMTKDPHTLTRGSTLAEAARLMRDEDAGAIPIVEGERLIAMVTDRDIAIRGVAESKDPESTTVEQIASTQLVTVDAGQSLDEALRLMAEHQVRRLPIVEEDGTLIGIVAQADVARHADASRAGETVERISR